jgi:hypothetical protein
MTRRWLGVARKVDLFQSGTRSERYGATIPLEINSPGDEA